MDAVPKSRKWLALSIFLAFSATAAQVALMGTSAWLLTFAALIVPPLFLQTPAVLVRFFAISRAALRYAERLASHNLALRMQSALRMVTYQRLAGTTLLGRRRGDLLTRVVADVEAVKDLMVRVWIPFISATGVILITGLALGFISPGSGLVVLASAAVAGLLLPWLAQRGSAKADAEAVPLRGELGNAVHEIATAAPDLVAYGADGTYTEKLLAIDGKLRDDEARSTWVRGITTAGQLLAAGIAVVGALLIGGAQAHNGVLLPQMMDWITNMVFLNATPPPMYAMQATVLAVLVLTPLALHEALSNLVQAAQVNTRAQAALARVEEILDAEPVGSGDLPSLPDPVADPGLSLHDLSVGWPGQDPVQTGLSLELARGEIVGLVGPSGIGKTTVAATVLGLIPPVSGEAVIRGRVGYLPQDAHIFTTSVAENVKIGNKFATDAEVRAALHRSGLAVDPHRLVGETGAHLSGGEARRVALARLLVGEFQVLILDEPTEHLDLLTATALMDDIWQNTSDAAVLVITHDPAVISRCDRVITLA
ncbi:MAG TPA: thiol reductant ABC exporter subunit CydC [Propionicimonas sp.]|nr:thiol reductant ABC exporter subunit CydC [Propionicimonas sp.]